MQIVLMVNNSENNKINKNLITGETLTGTLRNESDVINPNVLIAAENPTNYNYCYIEEFKRYYYIKDITSVRTGIWQLSLKSDPLKSFATQILACSGILDETETTGAQNYLDGRNWVALTKSKTDIINFSSGLNEDGEFILITAGG